MSDEHRHPLAPDAVALADDAARMCDALAEDAIPPGLADVIRRAADAMPDLGTREEAELAAALDALPETGEVGATAFGGLEDFIDAARSHADALTEQRAHEPMPALPHPASPPRRVMMPLLLAAAAVLLLAPLIWAGIPSTLFDANGPVETSGEAALQSLEQQDESTPFVERTPKPQRPKQRTIAREPEEEIEIIPDPPMVEPEVVASPMRRPSPSDRVASLDAEARAAWQIGDLGLAEDKFRQLVRVGRRGKAVDLAYGDLFSIARQRADEPGLRRYWKQYAAKFPRGRWVDDARAGLCRTAPASDVRSCWRSYLADRPRGTYRRDAEAALK